ncbi:FMN-dependent dehydrogenase [Phlyctema vagabunda]|uniref:FMN-dependent dehydrogenase n=1 Tax=Phlyctema vagabunda TaxID=108571 RepID=A0ABR4PAM5_9HELO
MPLSGAEIAKHNSRESCWVIVHGKAYDVTDFLPEHPGGPKIILKYAGKDATEEYEPIHPPDTLDKYLDKSKHLGPVDMGTVEQEKKEEDPLEIERQDRIARMPILEQCFNLMDFEAVARKTMKKTAWAYYSSGADDEITMRENHTAFHKIWFRPRILVDVEKVDFTTTMLGTKVDIPFYVTATALGKLGHKEGEVIFTRAAKKHNVVQMIPTLASCSFDEIMDAAEGDQVQWLQLYVNKDREITKKIVQHAEKRGCKGLFITVDAPQLGRREKDMRSKFTDVGSNVQSSSGTQTDNSQGAARAISSFIDPALSWKDIPWFQSITKMPILLKGVQRVEDVIRAIESGVQGVVLSNHGGRQLDFARSGIEVLAEVMPVLRERGWENRIEIYVDGGIRRSTDIIKALCLGAKGVGIGRPFLYAMSAYGLAGVDRAMQLLKDEMEMNMRLIGCSSVDQLNPTLIDTRGLSSHTTTVPVDTLGMTVYDPLVNPKEKAKL